MASQYNLNLIHMFLLTSMPHTKNGQASTKGSKKVYYKNQKRKARLMKQFKRKNKNPARSNRHSFTNKDMKSW